MLMVWETHILAVMGVVGRYGIFRKAAEVDYRASVGIVVLALRLRFQARVHSSGRCLLPVYQNSSL